MVLAGILHDTFTDENGEEVPYTDKVIGVLDDEVFKCVSVPDFMSFDMPKEEFLAKVTDIQEIWSK